MSDFFGDDFTAELKNFFLNQFLNEVHQLIETADEESWLVFRDEMLEKSKDWIRDAATNEFGYFADWLSGICQSLQECVQKNVFDEHLELLEKYLQLLLVSKKDAEDYPTQFKLLSVDKSSRLYLHCIIDDQDIVLPIQNVIEVLGSKTISPLPQSQKNITGMLAYRGEAIPVFNLRKKNDHENRNVSNYVVCEIQNQHFALEVSRVDQLFEINSQDLQAKNDDSHLFSTDFISHFVIHENKNLMLFDLEKMVAS